MRILGIETSCDETAVAIVNDQKQILSNIVWSQIPIHQEYGGVIPEIAARNHLHALPRIVDDALSQAKCTLSDIDAIAVTSGPGLIGGVLIGVLYAQGLAIALKKPCFGINHLEGHALTPRLTHDIDFPFLLTLVSGGHCQFLKVLGVGAYELLGTTIDDAVGEAFDKVAKMMGLAYPGGPIIEKLAQKGDENAFDLPRPLLHQGGYDVSFSGLKTAVKNIIDKQNNPLDDTFKADMAASFQKAVGDIFVKKTTSLITNEGFKRLVVAGGVAANQYLRKRLEDAMNACEVKLFTPPLAL
ncbi:MAG: tRNA (adenosine(37)-N6)-threonylcarbamoyltransferase complex transferase subunit TsaD, partial [Alphaproteobacteria bacterium]|nr:tRNA (adenosine(37)-N6)-threonylcarbamoyltransferase complex transferase subunit TsaD [Alphaproteobacteria bacterium]